ncbi:MAG: ATP-binding cassette domain-containing protein, partial [Oscillospiraceae bacterium]
RKGATTAQVEQAARAAGCDAFIRSLENGYDTMAGGAGGHLSGGERQRIALARAMLKDAPIVILDEATAYIDPENEAVIQKAVGKLVAGKTLIVIAHRLSTITDSDQIVVINKGNVEAAGTQKDLLKNCRLYQQMWQAHTGAKDGEEE